ncbi:MAG: hypothetical protein RJA87_826 [Pseudomonadota bacterium]|jgi:fructuronate reductase
MRLSDGSLTHLAPDVIRPSYDFRAQEVGLVHIGIGAFHRAHQAWYTHLAMEAGDRNWAITGVSMRSPSVALQMNPQNGLYTVTERSDAGAMTRLIGAVRDVIVARQSTEMLIESVAAPTTHIVSFTITEKGYCRASDGRLDFDLAAQSGLFDSLAKALRRRHDAGRSGLTLLSCDNLTENGQLLAGLMRDYLDRYDPKLTRWFETECACPSTMVDRIVPATTEEDRTAVAARIGMDDEAAVMTEPFSQWVIEDRFAGPRPRWEAVGVELVSDVRPYEMAKLRLLNAAHSALAYIGLSQGYHFVHEAMADPVIRALIVQLMTQEAAPTIDTAPGQDLDRYAGALIDRFDNPALRHRLSQIAMDGSQKIPQRWLETLAANQSMGQACPAILRAIAAWMSHLRGANGPVDDPRAAELIAGASGPDPASALFGGHGLVRSRWLPQPIDHAIMTDHLSKA